MGYRFQARVEQARGPGATVVLITPDVAKALGGLKQQRVLMSVKGSDKFTSSTYPWKGEILEPVADAKKPETRAARLAKALDDLRAMG